MTTYPNVFLIGPMGAGKTTIGKLLAQKLGYVFFDSDQEIESASGVPLTWIFDYEGEEGFRAREAKVIKQLTQKSGIVLSTGGGSIISVKNRAYLSQRGHVVYLAVDLETQLQRLRKSQTRPLLKKAKPELILKKLMEEREAFYLEIADFTVDTTHHSVPAILNKIIRNLEKN